MKREIVLSKLTIYLFTEIELNCEKVISSVPEQPTEKFSEDPRLLPLCFSALKVKTQN